MKNRLLVLLVSLTLAIGLVVVGCTTPATTPATTPTTTPATTPATTPEPEEELPPIKIGALLPFKYPQDAEPMERGITAKLIEIGWEVAGRGIQLIAEDDAGDPVTAVEKCRKLVQVDKVDVILGALWGNVSPAVSNYLTPFRTPMIMYGEGARKILGYGGNNVLHWRGTMQQFGYLVGLYAYDELGLRTSVSMYSDYESGNNFAEGWEIGFTKERDGAILQELKVPFGTLDFAPYFAAMPDVDCVGFFFVPPEDGIFLKQYREWEMEPTLVSWNCWGVGPVLLASVGDAALDVVTPLSYSPFLDTPVNTAFVSFYEDRYGQLPQYDDVSGYVAAMLFIEGVKATDGDTSPDVLNPALHALKIETPAGWVSFTSDGLGIADTHIAKVVKTSDLGVTDVCDYQYEVLTTFSQMEQDCPEEYR